MIDPYPSGRYQVDGVRLADELTYRNYVYNRERAPHTPHERWGLIYGTERVTIMEARYQHELEAIQNAQSALR